MRNQLRGGEAYTLIELLIVLSLVVIFGAALFLSIGGKRPAVELDTATREVVALLREAQEKSIAQASGSGWGVHFENSSSSPFYALFSGPYSASTTSARRNLPSRVRYATSSIATDSSKEIIFSEGTGRPSASETIILVPASGVVGSATSSVITVNALGAISF